MKLLKKEWLQLLILITPFCAAALLWDKLPDRFPVHWNVRGEVDGYGGKVFGVIFPAVLNVGLALLLGLLPRIDPKCRNYDAETQSGIARIFKIGRLTLTAMLTCVILGICANALHRQFDMTRFAVSALALMFIVLGNFMGKLRPNYFMGFRTPWTLESRTVWLKTHRLGGYLMVGCGFILLVESFFLTARTYFLAGLLPVMVLITIIPAAYSYCIYRAENKNQNPAH
ncbi:MAG: SdpI family protein [Verrucomicrobia bacterium]|nr:SdpI family protein [Verrucomicrobiota bacterium]